MVGRLGFPPKRALRPPSTARNREFPRKYVTGDRGGRTHSDRESTRSTEHDQYAGEEADPARECVTDRGTDGRGLAGPLPNRGTAGRPGIVPGDGRAPWADGAGDLPHVLNQDQDAEDAFQATFLVLARKAATIRNRRVLSGWLHEIAYRIAIKARAGGVRVANSKRRAWPCCPRGSSRTIKASRRPGTSCGPVLHEEVNRLPDKYRIPVILSYLEGKTNEEVAEQLRWPVGTVKGRLSRARDLLSRG